MRFSVEVKRLKDSTMYVCHGCLEQGRSSEYLFNLLTRADQKDVIVDVAELRVEQNGLHVLALSWQFLSSTRRRLFLENAPEALLEDLRNQYGVVPFRHDSETSRVAAARAVNGSSL
jgi:hypothetical protein